METQIIDIHHTLIKSCLKTAETKDEKQDKRTAQYELYKIYYKAMYNTALRIVSNTGEAEDIMQNSFLDAFSKLHSWNGTGTFGSWLKRIVVNNSVDALRKHREFRLLADDDLEIPDYNYEEQTDDFKDKIALIKTALQQLGNEDRIILSLFLLEGYDHEEISEILGISYSASRTRYSRAKSRLLGLVRAKHLHKINAN